MAQFARYRYGNLQDDNLQDVDMNTISKDMIHSLNLNPNGMWIYVIIKVENA